MRQLQEAADLHAQVQWFDEQARRYDVRDILEQQKRMERDWQLQRTDILQDIQVAKQLHYTLGANHQDLQMAVEEALDHHERIQDALGTDALEMATSLAE
jgi:hypothetical protein